LSNAIAGTRPKKDGQPLLADGTTAARFAQNGDFGISPWQFYDETTHFRVHAEEA
jgi:hypothetical protein